jgi:ubiquinone/menaquinone biosynthesis C-methylase UbiE
MSGYIHGGSDAREVARLEKQAGFISARFQSHLRAAPGHWVLDLATGVGAMAQKLIERYPGIQLVGLDLNRSPLRHARQNHPIAAYVQGDGARMPFADQTFDRVHCSWMLEHVPSPVEILRDVHRVLKVGGECLFIEVDNATFRTVPEYPEVVAVMEALNEAQLRGGGDPYVGRKLPALFREAGFTQTEVQPIALHGSLEDPVFFQAFIDEFAEIFESLDESVDRALVPRLHAAAGRLRALPSVGGQMHYQGYIARGVR